MSRGKIYCVLTNLPIVPVCRGYSSCLNNKVGVGQGIVSFGLDVSYSRLAVRVGVGFLLLLETRITL